MSKNDAFRIMEETAAGLAFIAVCFAGAVFSMVPR